MKVSTEKLRAALRILNVIPANRIGHASLFFRLVWYPDDSVLSITIASIARGQVLVPGEVEKGDPDGWWMFFVDRKVLEALSDSAAATIRFQYTPDSLTVRAGTRARRLNGSLGRSRRRSR